MADKKTVRVPSKGKVKQSFPVMEGQDLKPRMDPGMIKKFGREFEEGMQHLLSQYPDMSEEVKALFYQISIGNLLSFPSSGNDSHIRNLIRGFLEQFRGLADAYMDLDHRIRCAMISAHSSSEEISKLRNQIDDESLSQELVTSWAEYLEQFALLVSPVKKLVDSTYQIVDACRGRTESLQTDIQHLKTTEGGFLANFNFDLANGRLDAQATALSVERFGRIGKTLEECRQRAGGIATQIAERAEIVGAKLQELEANDELRTAYRELIFYHRICTQYNLATPDAIGLFEPDEFQEMLSIFQNPDNAPVSLFESVRRLMTELARLKEQAKLPIQLPEWDKVRDRLMEKGLLLGPERQAAVCIDVQAKTPKPQAEESSEMSECLDGIEFSGQAFLLGSNPAESLFLKMACALAVTSKDYRRARMLHVVFKHLLQEPGLLTPAEEQLYDQVRDRINQSSHTLKQEESMTAKLKSVSQWFVRTTRRSKDPDKRGGYNWRFCCSKSGIRALAAQLEVFATDEVVDIWQRVIEARAQYYKAKNE